MVNKPVFANAPELEIFCLVVSQMHHKLEDIRIETTTEVAEVLITMLNKLHRLLEAIFHLVTI